MMNPFELLKNMNEIKGQVEATKARIATIKCTGYAGGNMVEAVANGKIEIESIKIDPGQDSFYRGRFVVHHQ